MVAIDFLDIPASVHDISKLSRNLWSIDIQGGAQGDPRKIFPTYPDIPIATFNSLISMCTASSTPSWPLY